MALLGTAPVDAFPDCVSPFGVHDMVGNVDEWVVNEKGKPHHSGLKGGYWSWVRGRCRPLTDGHEEDFRYYQIGFRCCGDVPNAPSAAAVERFPEPLIAAGVVEGARTTAGIRVFRGVPFAAPPVGELRWRPPQPPAPWMSGILGAMAMASAAALLPRVTMIAVRSPGVASTTKCGRRWPPI